MWNGMLNVECGMWNGCAMRNVECGVWNGCAMLNVNRNNIIIETIK